MQDERMNLFAYGTLMWPEVLEAVTGRRMTGEKMTLSGYKRLRVKGERYPVVIDSARDSVEGVFYRNLSTREFQCLDRFEGEQYDRIEQTFGAERAFVYVLSKDWKHIAEIEVWGPEHLTEEDLAAFLQEYKGGLTG
jgi:gamma-glutamylcyclotransferase (GGCT)/AIG2-like uncharacterized protein YtfP